MEVLMGLWLIPTAFTVLFFYLSIDTRRTPPRDFALADPIDLIWRATMDGTSAVVDKIVAIIASIFVWGIYAVVV